VFLLSVCLDSAILSEQTLGPAAVAAELLNLVQLYSCTAVQYIVHRTSIVATVPVRLYDCTTAIWVWGVDLQYSRRAVLRVQLLYSLLYSWAGRSSRSASKKHGDATRGRSTNPLENRESRIEKLPVVEEEFGTWRSLAIRLSPHRSALPPVTPRHASAGAGGRHRPQARGSALVSAGASDA
jgi:hypothetical protein